MHTYTQNFSSEIEEGTEELRKGKCKQSFNNAKREENLREKQEQGNII